MVHDDDVISFLDGNFEIESEIEIKDNLDMEVSQGIRMCISMSVIHFGAHIHICIADRQLDIFNLREKDDITKGYGKAHTLESLPKASRKSGDPSSQPFPDQLFSAKRYTRRRRWKF